MSLKKLIKQNNVIILIYNILNSNYLKYISKIKCQGILKNTRFFISSKDVKIIIPKGTSLINCQIYIYGSNSKIVFEGGNTSLSNTTLWVEDNGSSIHIGKGFSMQGGQISATEGKSITIGDGCMFSSGIDIRNGDSHGIFSTETNKRINEASSIIIGDQVWLAKDVTVLKGSKIASNVVIGNRALVTTTLNQSYAIYGGSPAKLLKENIIWSRNKYISKYEKN